MPETRPLSGDVIVHVFGRTDVGRTREHNEDAFIVADLTAGRATLQPEVRTHVTGERGTLFMVADGMGGAAAGEIASAMAVEVVLEELQRRWLGSPRADAEAFATALKEATEAANTAIHRYATEHPEYRGMGTTATVAGLLGDTLYLVQVGDSRGYIVRDGQARQITKDQSLMQRLIEAGEITEAEAEQSDRRNIILQALGPEPLVRIDLTHQRVRRGDTLILCSDGLSGLVRPEEIARVVSEEQDLMAICRRLIDRANDAGGPDNITVVAARFEGAGLDVATAGDEVGHRVYPLANGEATPTLPMERYVRRSGGPSDADALGVGGAAPAEAAGAAEPRARRTAALIALLILAAAALLVALRIGRQPAPAERDSAAAAPVAAPATMPAATPTPADTLRADSARADSVRTDSVPAAGGARDSAAPAAPAPVP